LPPRDCFEGCIGKHQESLPQVSLPGIFQHSDSHGNPSNSIPSKFFRTDYVDKGYAGHDAPKPLRVFRSGQRRGVHGQIKRELRRRSAIEAVIGHMKTDGHLGRNFLKGRHGDHANALLTAIGHNFRLILKWLKALLRQIIALIRDALIPRSTLKTAC
jgi:IS5 family transposase